MMAHIERRVSRRRDASGKIRETVRCKVRYRDSSGRAHSETKRRRFDAERLKAEIEVELAGDSWRDPRLAEVLLHHWVAEWLPTRTHPRVTTRARLELTITKQVLPRFGDVPLRKITN